MGTSESLNSSTNPKRQLLSTTSFG